MDLNLRKISLITALIIANLGYGLSQTKSNDSTIFDTLHVQTENFDIKFYKESNFETNRQKEEITSSSTCLITTSTNLFKSLPSKIYDEAEKLNENSFKIYLQFNLKPDGTIQDAIIIGESKNKSFNTFVSNSLEELVIGINTSKKPDFFNNRMSLFMIPIYLNYK
jgi:hypothetical protein